VALGDWRWLFWSGDRFLVLAKGSLDLQGHIIGEIDHAGFIVFAQQCVNGSFLVEDHKTKSTMLLWRSSFPGTAIVVEQLQPSLLDLAYLAAHLVESILIDRLRDASNEHLSSLKPGRLINGAWRTKWRWLSLRRRCSILLLLMLRGLHLVFKLELCTRRARW